MSFAVKRADALWRRYVVVPLLAAGRFPELCGHAAQLVQVRYIAAMIGERCLSRLALYQVANMALLNAN